MKNFIFISLTFVLTSLASIPALAEDCPKGRIVIDEPELGKMVVEVKCVGEPVYSKSRLTIKVLCKDRRDARTSLRPSWKTLIKNEPICEFRPHKYDAQDKTLKLHFSTSGFTTGEAHCDSPWAQPFDLKEACKGWQ